MESYRRQSYSSFMDEEKRNINLPRRLSFGNQESETHPSLPRAFSTSATSSPIWPMSPETPWNLSSVKESSSNNKLLYHCLASMHRYEGKIYSIAVSEGIIYTSSESSRIHAWNQHECTEMGYIKASAGEVRAILAYGKLLFTTHGDNKIRVWDVSQRENFRPKKIATLPQKNSLFSFLKKKPHQHKDQISCIAYNQTEKILYTGSCDKSVKAWKVAERRCVDSFIAHEGIINAIIINQRDGCVFTCSSDGTIKIWRRVYGENSHILTITLKFQLSPINALALSSSLSGNFLYSGSSDGLINLWGKEKTSGRFNHGGFLQGHQFSILCLVTIGDLILSGSEDATIRVWKREEGGFSHSCLAVMDEHYGPVRCLAASIEVDDIVRGLLVYSASSDQTFKMWRVKICPMDTVKNEEKEINQDLQIAECVMSPVLSPSWVEKKLQGTHF